MSATVIIVILAGALQGKQIQVPEILGSALTTILGFYFGRYTAGAPHGGGSAVSGAE